MEDASRGSFTPKQRQALFLEMAAKPGGTTAQQVYEDAIGRGDDVTIEAYHNLGRRLTHRGLLYTEKEDRQTVFKIAATVDGQWLDEEQIAAIIDPDYPLIALAVAKEARRQLTEIPEHVWVEVRTRLQNVDAPQLFFEEICAYADDLVLAFQEYRMQSAAGFSVLGPLRGEIESSLLLLKQLTKYGLGLSSDAIQVPMNFDAGLERARARPNDALYDETILRDELQR